MKTFLELAEWVAGAAEQFGDPSVPVGQAFMRWHADTERWKDVIFGQENLACGMMRDELVLALGPAFPALPLPVVTGRPRIGNDGELEAYGAELLVPGVWVISPSLNAPGLIHAFIILYGVPDPAPWESRILIAR